MQLYRPGTVVAVSVGTVDHVGILTDQIVGGAPTVISNSMRAGGVAEDPLHTFGGGREIRVLGHPGHLSQREVLRRARSQLGKRWRLFSWNCEHFVHWAHGLKPSSPQLTVGISLLALLGIAAALISPRR